MKMSATNNLLFDYTHEPLPIMAAHMTNVTYLPHLLYWFGYTVIRAITGSVQKF